MLSKKQPPRGQADLSASLGRFIEDSSSEHMPEVASRLLELLETDAVEPLGSPGRLVSAEAMAEHLETRIQRLMLRDEPPEGIELLEDAVCHLRARDREAVAPWSFEDGEGIRWFVLASQSEVVACYTNEAFVESAAD